MTTPVVSAQALVLLFGNGTVPTVYVRTLKRAAEIVGGEEELARRLKVTPTHLNLWISGLASPPGDVFLQAADAVSEYELQQMMVVKHAVPPQATDL